MSNDDDNFAAGLVNGLWMSIILWVILYWIWRLI